MKKFLIGFCFILSACSPVVDDGRLDAVVTVGMLGDVVRNVGGDLVEVIDLMGPGVDPHLYKPSFSDTGLVESADVVFYVGLNLEAKMIELFEELDDEKKIVAVGDSVDAGSLISNDPHIWFDTALWSEVVDPVVEALVELDPENEDVYRANGEKYLSELASLEAWVNDYVSDLPEEKRVLVTAHDAFNYFGQAYGFEVLGVQGISTASDYGLKDLESLIDIIVEKEVKAIFGETSVSGQSIEALRQGVLAKGFEVEIGGSLFSDAMGAKDSPEGSYVGMVKYNVTKIVDALR